MAKIKKQNKKRKEEGQAMIEFALVLPLFILIIFAIIEFGWVFYNMISVENSARNAARIACVSYEDVSSTYTVDLSTCRSILQKGGYDVKDANGNDVDLSKDDFLQKCDVEALLSTYDDDLSVNISNSGSSDIHSLEEVAVYQAAFNTASDLIPSDRWDSIYVIVKYSSSPKSNGSVTVTTKCDCSMLTGMFNWCLHTNEAQGSATTVTGDDGRQHDSGTRTTTGISTFHVEKQPGESDGDYEDVTTSAGG